MNSNLQPEAAAGRMEGAVPEKSAPPPQPTTSFPCRRPPGRVVRAAAFVFLGVVFLPSAFFVQPGFGMEPSWHLLMNQAFSGHWVFGKQFIWTYGPLGFLEWRIPYGVNLWYYVGFDLLIVLLFLTLARDALRLKLDWALAAGCCAALFVAKALVNDASPAALYCLVVGLLVRNLRQPGFLTSACLVVGSTVLFFYKLNLGFATFGLCSLVCLFKILARDKSAKPWMLLVLSHLLLVWLLASPLHVSLLAYLGNGLMIMRRFSDGMGLGPEPGTLSHWVICLFFSASLVVSAVAAAKGGGAKESLLSGLATVAALFVLFKAAIVRSDYAFHNKSFLFGFPVIALALVIHAPEAGRKLWRLLFLGSTSYAALLLAAEHLGDFHRLNVGKLEAFFPVNYVRGLGAYDRHKAWKSYHDSMRTSDRARLVPEEVCALIGTNRVDVFPHEYTLALGSGLNFQSRPVPQSYLVMDEALEARNLEFFWSEQAPRYVLYSLGPKGVSPDNRYPLWDEPAVKRLLQENYVSRLVFTNLQGGEPRPTPTLLLERTRATEPGLEPTAAATVAQAGRAFPLPGHEGELYASIRLRQTWLGRLVSFLYRSAPVRVQFHLENGMEQDYRVIPSNLERGVLVNYFAAADDPQAAINYFGHQSRGNLKCLRLRLDFEHPWEFKREFEVRYLSRRVAPAPLANAAAECYGKKSLDHPIQLTVCSELSGPGRAADSGVCLGSARGCRWHPMLPRGGSPGQAANRLPPIATSRLTGLRAAEVRTGAAQTERQSWTTFRETAGLLARGSGPSTAADR